MFICDNKAAAALNMENLTDKRGDTLVLDLRGGGFIARFSRK